MNLKLEKEIDSITALTVEELSEKFNCRPEEICMGDYMARYTNDKSCPYKVILGYANFEGSQVESLGKLEIVYGKKLKDKGGDIRDVNGQAIYSGITVKNSKIRSFGNLKKVYGSIDIGKEITSLGNIEFLGSNLYIGNTRINDLGNLQEIDGTLNITIDRDHKVTAEEIPYCLKTLGNLKIARKIIIESDFLTDLGSLEMVKTTLQINAKNLSSLGNLRKVGKLVLSANNLRDLGVLEKVKAISLTSKCNDHVRMYIKKHFVKADNTIVRKDDIETNID